MLLQDEMQRNIGMAFQDELAGCLCVLDVFGTSDATLQAEGVRRESQIFV